MLRVQPIAGTAILWFNHELEPDGSLGSVDLLSMHGGCRLREDANSPVSHFTVIQSTEFQSCTIDHHPQLWIRGHNCCDFATTSMIATSIHADVWHSYHQHVQDKWVANHWIEVSEDLEQDVAETERVIRMFYDGRKN